MKHIKILTLLLAAAIAAFIIYSSQSTPAEDVPSVSNQVSPAPAWSLTDITGKTIQGSDLKGKVVILDFWATWCPPCQEEIPDFIDLQKKYGDQGLVVVGASVDEDGLSVVKKFAAKVGMNYTVGLADDKLQRAFGGTDILPTTIVIDRQGRIVQKYQGIAEKDQFETEIKSLLQAKS